MDKVKTKVWIMCEAFTLTGDAFGHQTVHESLAPWSVPCIDRKTAMRELKKAVRMRVIENYYGLDDADDLARSDIKEVLSSPVKLGRDKTQYNYSTEDREVVWRVFAKNVAHERGVENGGQR